MTRPPSNCGPGGRRGRAGRSTALVAEVTAPPCGGPPEPTPGAAHDWLCAALAAQTGG
ncbi:hypothetical protein [Streptomyces sp. PR69]|uniref:hypothetical protein n=1 Tax=Streptomyces sp. PR69 TaxID=2984950 RepID=UPI003A5BF1E9